LVCEAHGGGIFHLPDALPTLLAKLGDEDLPEVAERWAQGGELSFDQQFQISLGYSVDNYVQGVVLILRELRDFSRQALMANKPLLLWM